MDHDLAAELAGYRAELEHCERLDKAERVEAIRGEIRRVREAMQEKAARFERQAEVHDETGQGVLAAQAREEAARYREMAGDDEDGQEEKPEAPKTARGRGRPRKEDTADKTPRERA